ncbi:MAG: DUF2220 family protein [Clostridia bacterium]|nr:DUF2220 family protein [Clostridia bacterium]
MNNYDKKILGQLLDKYESSKSFINRNIVKQSFSVETAKLFPEYEDESEYDVYISINESIERLYSNGFIKYDKKKNGVVTKITLECNAIEACYEYLKREPKKDIYSRLRAMLIDYKDKNDVLSRYCAEQLHRIDENKSVRYFDGDFDGYKCILKALSEITDVKKETLQRDFSVKVLGDSKTFEKIKNKVVSILFEYGDFPKKETILEDLNIMRNPGHIYFKGNGEISIGGQIIDFSKIDGDLAISASLLDTVDRITVKGDTVMTVENLTSFNSFSDNSVLAIYLGGYHNTDRRNFICKVYEQNSGKRFLHYGDIDAGGFYILLHLRKKTGIDFKPYCMDIETLKKYADYTKKLTENDRKRLECLKESEFCDVVSYMLNNNCKLEQEALDI